jgi:ribosomal protein S27E
MKYRNLRICPRCGGNTNTYRHAYAKVWCPNCECVLRNEGDQTIQHKNGSCKLNLNEEEEEEV